MSLSVEQALEHWERKGLITKKKAKELEQSLMNDHEIPSNALRIFAAVGAVLIGLGVILFVSSNWDAMTPILKITVLLAGMLGTGIGGYYLKYIREYEKIGTALLFVNIFIFGASIFLIAQIYHLTLTFWWGALLWYIGTAFMAYVLQSRLHAWFSVPLLVLFLGWLRSSVGMGAQEELDFLFDERTSLMTLLPIIGVGLMSLSTVHRKYRSTEFAAPTLFHWGVFLVMFFFVIATVEKTVFFNFFRLRWEAFTVVIVLASLFLFAASQLWGKFLVSSGRVGLSATAAYIVFVYLLAAVPGWLGLNVTGTFGFERQFAELDMVTGLFVLYVLLTFFFLMLAVWFGTMMKDPPEINMGMLGMAAVIFIQYFSWVFELLPRSLFFIIGGIVILLFTSVLEKKRRQLIASFS